jgi:hypothetical protein
MCATTHTGVVQTEVFDEVAPLVMSCADGYSGCILAYGQTGSGKTHTMTGSHDNPGNPKTSFVAWFPGNSLCLCKP